MKKVLVILLLFVFVLSITSIGMAGPANPFDDVPAQHWSYEAISKLAKAGIIDGYNDGLFHGEQTMTRYEMAQIVGKAISHSAKADADNRIIINKLANEFSDELKSLGLRLDMVEKKIGALDKKVGETKISGDGRLRWDNAHLASGDTKFRQRWRIFIDSKASQDTSFHGMVNVLNQHEMGAFGVNAPYNPTSSTDTPYTQMAFFQTNNFLGLGDTLYAGRLPLSLGAINYWICATGFDGVMVSAGKDLNVKAGFANFGPAAQAASDSGYTLTQSTRNGKFMAQDAFFLQATYKSSPVTTWKGFVFKEKTGSDSKFDMKSLGFATRLTPFATFTAEYGKNSKDIGGNGTVGSGLKPEYYVLNLTMGRGPNGPMFPSTKGNSGDYGIGIEYRKWDPYAMVGGYTGCYVPSDNIKGWQLYGIYALDKNVTLDVFQTLGSKRVTTGASLNTYTRLQVNYWF